MEGGAILGYCSMGIRRIANAPKSIMSTAMTIAKIGRPMKNLDIRTSPYLEEAVGASVCATGPPFCAGCGCWPEVTGGVGAACCADGGCCCTGCCCDCGWVGA